MASRITKEKCLENTFKNITSLIEIFNEIFPEEGLTVYNTLLKRKRSADFDLQILQNLKETYNKHQTQIDSKDEALFSDLISAAETRPELTKEGKEILTHLAKIYSTKRDKIPQPKKILIWEKVTLVCKYADKYFTF